jgi:hypothetical protein
MREGWSKRPEERPEFSVILQRLDSMGAGGAFPANFADLVRAYKAEIDVSIELLSSLLTLVIHFLVEIEGCAP